MNYTLLRERILKHATDQYSWSNLRGPSPYAEMKRAAVLIPLFIRDGEVHVWLTRRSQSVSADKGHVAFPGGMRDPGDADEGATCLREAEEEVGLQRHQVEVVARYLPSVNARGVFITPMVGFVSEDFVPTPNVEVDVAFHLPLARFLTVEDYFMDVYHGTTQDYYVHFFADDVSGETITTWGLTAGICVELAVAVLQKQTEFDFALSGKLYPSDPYRERRVMLQRAEQKQNSKL